MYVLDTGPWLKSRASWTRFTYPLNARPGTRLGACARWARGHGSPAAKVDTGPWGPQGDMDRGRDGLLPAWGY